MHYIYERANLWCLDTKKLMERENGTTCPMLQYELVVKLETLNKIKIGREKL